jgi:hypothetical protein
MAAYACRAAEMGRSRPAGFHASLPLASTAARRFASSSSPTAIRRVRFGMSISMRSPS